jgi:glycosyltransferase involved in cell wall biosynthesis
VPDARPTAEPTAVSNAVSNASTIADRLVATAVDVLDGLATGVAPGLALPATLAGHRVDADAHADLLFALGLLYEAGAGEVAGLDVRETILRRLATVDAARTHTFFSYRVAETAARVGGLDALDAATRTRVVEAADSTDWLPLLDQGLPRNYAVVLARCEAARARLGLDVDPEVLDDLLDRARALLGEHSEGWLDDAPDGRGQVDMYTVDAYLFAEPFAERLGDVWERGVRSAARLVEAVATPGGQALPWGRSIGALAVCHTAELAGVLLRRGIEVDAPRWLGLAAAAAEAAPGWFDGGLVVAHKRRAPFRYRGPHRRLQMTLDCAGKLVTAALDLRSAITASAAAGAGVEAAPPGEVFAARDEWVGFGDGIGVWSHRDPRLSFALPVVGGPGADYAPSPRHPGTFEVPTDRPLVCFLPVVWRGEARFVPGGRAASVARLPGALDLSHDGFVAAATDLGAEPEALAGRRQARYRADGRALHVDEHLTFERRPGALAVMVPETAGQPLLVAAEGDAVERVTTVDVDGLAEWRSVTGELRAVHQVELRPATELRFRWSVTPRLRIVSTADHHWYHRCLYGPLGDRVHVRPMPYHLLDRPDRLAAALASADVLHLHWPEWVTGPSVGRARRVAAAVAEAGVPVLWTQHNVAPHAAPDKAEMYAVWAELADGVIHHSEWGRQAITARYRFRPDALHAVVPHGHWGPLMAEADGGEPPDRSADRAAAEAELGLAPCHLRIGMVGAPRSGKDTQLVLDGLAASTRPDVQLLVLCHDGEEVPDDPRITVRPYEEVPRRTYDRRLAAIDVLALPLEGGTYLTTGQVADAVGAGIPALVSPWPYLHEMLGEGGIPYGRTAVDLAATLDGLSDEAVAAARAAVVARRPALDWGRLAEATWDVLDEVAARGAARRPR